MRPTSTPRRSGWRSSELEAAGFGAVVAIEPTSGRVRVLASNPALRPQPRPRTSLRAQPRPGLAAARPGDPGPVPARLDLQGRDRGGRASTAARSTPETTIDAPGTIEVQGKPLANDFNQSFGPIGLDTALTNSVNTWFAQLGEQIGGDTLFEYMDALRLRLEAADRPALQSGLPRAASSRTGRCSAATTRSTSPRIAIGQERLAVTPLQMAMVAAAVANGGSLMRPQIWSRVVDPDGRVVERLDPSRVQPPDRRGDGGAS